MNRYVDNSVKAESEVKKSQVLIIKHLRHWSYLPENAPCCCFVCKRRSGLRFLAFAEHLQFSDLLEVQLMQNC